MTVNTSIAGKAVYLEFRHGNHTQQIILTPESVMLGGKTVPMTCYRRKISSANPRKTWKQVSSMAMSEVAGGTYIPMTKEHALATVPNRLMFTDSLFNQLINQGWQLYKQPIAVEVTQEDLEDIRMSKTPYKILGRITRSRRALNFGEPLFAE
jgi:hypothetical protein